jgi:hypothetical protein
MASDDKPQPEETTAPQEFSFPAWVFPVLSWIVAAYFIVGFMKNSTYPPDAAARTSLLALPGIFFLFLPFFSKIKLGKFLELEREVKKTKRELSDFKAEVRNTLSVLSTNVNTIGGMNNQVTVNLPPVAELQQARQEVAAAIPAKAKMHVGTVESKIIRQSEDDVTMALARTRIDIERTLREALSKQTAFEPDQESMKFTNVTKLFALAVEKQPQLRSLQKAFKYVTQVCNAAIHGHQVSYEQADEALALGAEILTALQVFERGDLSFEWSNGAR